MEINTYFTQQTDVKSIILDQLDSAQMEVLVAVAWFTEPRLFEKLIELAGRNVNVQIIITRHEFNNDSPNDYSRIEHYGGFFAELGSEEELMHMKFCVIDSSVVISGSANWTKKAFSSHSEEVTVVKGDFKRANTFAQEFNRLKKLSGYHFEKESLDLGRALKLFNLIKAFIQIGDMPQMLPYAMQLGQIDGLAQISSALQEGNFNSALELMEKFERKHAQLVPSSDLEKAWLNSQINFLKMQVLDLESQKTEIEAIIEQFTHQQIIQLSPLLTKALKLKAKIFSKLKKHGVDDDSFEKAQQEYEEAQREYENAKESVIPDLSEEEKLDLKQIFREASKMCHPDSAYCIFDDKNEASAVFSSLCEAYKSNNIQETARIFEDLKLGRKPVTHSSNDELLLMRAQYEHLKTVYHGLKVSLIELLTSSTYKTIAEIDDWRAYFDSQKAILTKEIAELESKFYQNG